MLGICMWVCSGFIRSFSMLGKKLLSCKMDCLLVWQIRLLHTAYVVYAGSFAPCIDYSIYLSRYIDVAFLDHHQKIATSIQSEINL